MNCETFHKKLGGIDCVVRRSSGKYQLSLPRGVTATLGTGVKLHDEPAKVRIGLPSILWVGGVHKLVAVVVHLHPAARANHLVSLGHSSHPCLRGSVERYLRTTLA